jgi:hypothetical protein
MNGEGHAPGSAPAPRRASRRAPAAGQEADGIPGGDGPSASAPSWRKIDKADLGAEQDYRVRAGDRETVARLNGHLQWIEAEGRRLLDWVPDEVVH